MRPEENRGGLPVRVRIERKHRSTPVVYVLSSWGKKLKGQLWEPNRKESSL